MKHDRHGSGTTRQGVNRDGKHGPPATRPRRRTVDLIRALGVRILSFAGFWWMLSEGHPDGWLPGGVAVAAATWASWRWLAPDRSGIRPGGLPGFVGFFLWNSVRGGVQVAAMALRGPAALQPALVEFPMILPAGAPRVLLINSLSLMPGTLGVDMDDSRLRLHVLDRRLPVVAEAQALEAVIARLFKAPP